jgi:hypothetical protein
MCGWCLIHSRQTVLANTLTLLAATQIATFPSLLVKTFCLIPIKAGMLWAPMEFLN